MNVGVAYADGKVQHWLKVDIDEGATVSDAIAKSGILNLCPQIDLANQKVGVFGKLVKLDASIRPGDRIEIYRAITCDPKTVPRRFSSEDDD